MKNQTNVANPTELANSILKDPQIQDKAKAIVEILSAQQHGGNKQNWVLIIIMIVSIFSGEIREFFTKDKVIMDHIQIIEEKMDHSTERLDKIEKAIEKKV